MTNSKLGALQGQDKMVPFKVGVINQPKERKLDPLTGLPWLDVRPLLDTPWYRAMAGPRKHPWKEQYLAWARKMDSDTERLFRTTPNWPAIRKKKFSSPALLMRVFGN